jgi:hypothetical protein
MNQINNMMNSMGARRSGGSSRGMSGGGGKGDIIPKGYNVGQLQNFTPEAMDLYQQLFGYLGPDSDLARLAGGDESYFQQMEAPALRQFNELQGGLASRFSGMGMGARKSSGFQNTATQASSNFAQDLASRRQELSRQALMDMFNMSNVLLGQKPYDRFLAEKPEKGPALGGWGPVLGTAAGAAGGFALGGPWGAFKGASIGSQAFSGL